MPKLIDLSGKKFGKLLVVSRAENIITPNGRAHVAWLCKCDCGNEKITRGDCLTNGHTTSCGCNNYVKTVQMGKNRLIDLTGQTFGYLTVLSRSPLSGKKGDAKWICECQCGNIVTVLGNNLRRKREATISCGCKKSKGEFKIGESLRKLKVMFETQKRFKTCIFPETNRQLVFDFYLPVENILIEFDGMQHFIMIGKDRYGFEEIKKRDLYKNDWCKKNNIVLIRIPYTDLNLIDENYMRRIIKRNG